MQEGGPGGDWAEEESTAVDLAEAEGWVAGMVKDSAAAATSAAGSAVAASVAAEAVAGSVALAAEATASVEAARAVERYP